MKRRSLFHKLVSKLKGDDLDTRLRTLAMRGTDPQRLRLLEEPNLDQRTLEVLARRGSKIIRLAVAAHPNLTEDTARKLRRITEPALQNALVARFGPIEDICSQKKTYESKQPTPSDQTEKANQPHIATNHQTEKPLPWLPTETLDIDMSNNAYLELGSMRSSASLSTEPSLTPEIPISKTQSDASFTYESQEQNGKLKAGFKREHHPLNLGFGIDNLAAKNVDLFGTALHRSESDNSAAAIDSIFYSHLDTSAPGINNLKTIALFASSLDADVGSPIPETNEQDERTLLEAEAERVINEIFSETSDSLAANEFIAQFSQYGGTTQIKQLVMLKESGWDVDDALTIWRARMLWNESQSVPAGTYALSYWTVAYLYGLFSGSPSEDDLFLSLTILKQMWAQGKLGPRRFRDFNRFITRWVKHHQTEWSTNSPPPLDILIS